LGLDNSPTEPYQPDLAALVLGYANSAFGVALNYSVAKIWVKNEKISDIPENSTRTTYPGDNLQVFFSLPIGGPTIYANAGWLTYGRSQAQTYDGNDYKEDYSSLTANAGLIGAAGSLNYDVSVFADRNGGTITYDNGDKYRDTADTYLALGLDLRLGIAALQKQNARVIAGVNTGFAIIFYDEVAANVNRVDANGIGRDKIKGDNIMAGHISPNILGEVALFDNLLAFAGATHKFLLQFGNGDRNEKTSYIRVASVDEDLLNAGTDAFAGVRFQKSDWALEAQVSANPFEALNGHNTFARFGGFVYF
jgi:hypothetical protein